MIPDESVEWGLGTARGAYDQSGFLVGGRGARLWPLSRENFPKVFQNLGSDQSLLQDTYGRIAGAPNVVAPTVLCNRKHSFLVRDQLRNEQSVAATIITEPVRRDTAPAIAAADTWLHRHDREALILVLPSDHLVTDAPMFLDAIARDAALGARGHLVTIGIEPESPETEYGYIKAGIPIEGNEGGLKVTRFVKSRTWRRRRRCSMRDKTCGTAACSSFPLKNC